VLFMPNLMAVPDLKNSPTVKWGDK
jgi:hypothetical protein